jgi:predicted nucleic acid-binding protein
VIFFDTNLLIYSTVNLFAEKYCSKIVTFDSDFKKFKDSTNIKIEIL